MASELICNTTGKETRVALMEDGRLTELLIDRGDERGFVGNVYLGRVVRVLPGMQAAFVDIGLERAAFLYVGDIYMDTLRLNARDDGVAVDDEPAVAEDGPRATSRPGQPPIHTSPQPLRKGTCSIVPLKSNWPSLARRRNSPCSLSSLSCSALSAWATSWQA